MSFTRKIKNGVLSCTELNGIYGIIAVPHAIQIKPYQEQDYLHEIGQMERNKLLRLSAKVLGLSGFQDGNLFVERIENGIILFNNLFDGDASSFDNVEGTVQITKDITGDAPKYAKAEHGLVRCSVANINIAQRLTAVGLRNTPLKGTIRYNGVQKWLELRPTKKTQALEGAAELVMRQIHIDQTFDGVSYLAKMDGGELRLPTWFRLIAGIKIEEVTQLPIWYNEADGCMVIEGPITDCSICGKPTRTTALEHMEEISLCNGCLEHTGKGNALNQLVDISKLTKDAKKEKDKAKEIKSNIQ